MSGMRSVSDKYQPVILNPVVAVHRGEVDPRGSSDVSRIS